MRIHRLRLVNFRQHELTELEFGAGLTGIIGPNGAGKTTLLEAIAWAMYGMPAARGSRETIRRRGAPPRSKVEVELEFSLGPHQYRVLRGLSQAELYQDGEAAPIANSLATVTERIVRLLGMTRDEFFNTYFTGQKELAVMAAMTAPERAQFLSRVLGYERIRTAQDRLKEKRSALRARLDALRAGLAGLTELDAEESKAAERVATASAADQQAVAAFEEAGCRFAEVHPRWEQLQQLRERALALDSELRVAEHEVGSATERVDRLSRQVAEADGARAKLDELWHQLEPLPALREEAERLKGQAESFATHQRIQAQLDEVKARLAATDERIARLPTESVVARARSRSAEIQAALAAATLESEERRTAWVRDAQDARTKRQGLLEQYRELKEQHDRIVKAGREGDCPTCARPLGAEFEKVLDVLDRQLEDVLFNGNFYKQRIEQLVNEPTELVEADRQRLMLEKEMSETSAEVGRLSAQAQDGTALHEERARLLARVAELDAGLAQLPASYDQAHHQGLQRRMSALEPLALQAERVRVVAERSDAVAAELAVLRQGLEEARGRADAVRREATALGYDETQYRKTQEADKAADRARRETEVALVHARAERTAAEEVVRSVAARRADRTTREAEASRTAAELALHQELDRALTDLRTELNTMLRPDLSELASNFLTDLTRGRYTELELDEDYVATLLDDGDPKSVISGGEEDVTNLALRLAISQMIAERAGQPLSLLVLDEIFGSLDEDRRMAVVDLLRSLADRFPQVILITHIESVRDGFDRVIRVGYDVARGVAVVRDEAVSGRDVAA